MLDTSHGRKFLGHCTKVLKMNMVIRIWRKTQLKRKERRGGARRGCVGRRRGGEEEEEKEEEERYRDR